jgi:hypothetical protein
LESEPMGFHLGHELTKVNNLLPTVRNLPRILTLREWPDWGTLALAAPANERLLRVELPRSGAKLRGSGFGAIAHFPSRVGYPAGSR